jgi:hypothetical protein
MGVFGDLGRFMEDGFGVLNVEKMKKIAVK